MCSAHQRIEGASLPAGDRQAEYESLALAVVCGSPVVRNGLERVLANASGVTVRYSADSLAVLLNYQAIPDLMIIDLYHLRGAQIGSAFWATLPGKLRVVALCRPEDPPDMIVALQGGVGALLTRESDVDELLTAVRTASKGGVYLSPELTGPLIVNNIKGGSDYRCLAPREIETLRLVAEGLTHRQISRRMGLSESTVSTYVKQIRTKLRAGNKADLTRAAIDLGYIGSVIQNSRS